MRSLLLFVAIKILFNWDLFAQSGVDNKLTAEAGWKINQDVFYDFLITEENIQSLPSVFDELNANKITARRTDMPPVFSYSSGTIALHRLNNGIYQMRLFCDSCDSPFGHIKSLSGIAGLIFQGEFTSQSATPSVRFTTEDYELFFSLLIMSVFNYDSELKIFKSDFPLFNSYFPFGNAELNSYYEYDSAGYTIPFEHLRLVGIDSTKQDYIGHFSGMFTKEAIGKISFDEIENYTTPENTSLLGVYYIIDLNYSFKKKQVYGVSSNIYINSNGLINICKKISININKITK